MSWSFPVGRLFGSEVKVHFTFLLLLLWVGISAWQVSGARAALYNVLFVIALFLCVVAHEFGHALMARHYGIRTPDVTLLPIGGVARLERMPENPVQEIWVALAGPAVSIVLWAILSLLDGTVSVLTQVETLNQAGQDFIGQLAAVNLFLVLFNMVPAFPMDGGRVFRAALALKLGRPRATQVAARVGQVAAVGFALAGILTANLILILIAFFVFASATAENADVQRRLTAGGLKARDAMITAFEPLAPADGLEAMSAALLRTTQHEFPVLDATGRLQGFVTREAIVQAAAGGGATAAEAMEQAIPEVSLTAPLEMALDALSRADTPAVAVTGSNGAFIGYITRENIGELMILKQNRRVA